MRSGIDPNTLIFEKIGDEDNEDATSFLSLTWLKDIGTGIADFINLRTFTGGADGFKPVIFKFKE